jgi:hypothetical protein
MNNAKPYKPLEHYSATFQIAGSKLNRQHPAEIVINIKKGGKQVAVIGLTYDIADKTWKVDNQGNPEKRPEGLFMKLCNNNRPVSYPATQKYINAQWQYANTCFKNTGVDRERVWDLISINYR